VIDLHLHTTASDGRCDAPTLVRRAWQAGLRTIAVTDHDSTAAVADATRAGRDFGIRVIAGIEITAVLDGEDVHVLGYFIDPDDHELAAFLAGQRADRVQRVMAIAQRLASLGKPIDIDALLRPLADRPDWSVGRPAIARALVAAGHVNSTGAAFQQLIGDGCPAWVPRRGATPVDVIRTVARAGGVASLAHPGLTGRDDCIAEWISQGLPAIEVHHSEHSSADVERYAEMAREFGVATSGGSDYHGDDRNGRSLLGAVTLPAEEFAGLEARAARPGRTV
jgi:predicted metal-dependent phosphoesterase TrpH